MLCKRAPSSKIIDLVTSRWLVNPRAAVLTIRVRSKIDGPVDFTRRRHEGQINANFFYQFCLRGVACVAMSPLKNIVVHTYLETKLCFKNGPLQIKYKCPWVQQLFFLSFSKILQLFITLILLLFYGEWRLTDNNCDGFVILLGNTWLIQI